MKILLIDIGNTETKFYLYEKKFTKKIKINSDRLNFNYLNKKLKFLNNKKILIDTIICSSVVPNLLNNLKKFFKKRINCNIIELKQKNLNKLIKIKINKYQVGSDRLANALSVADLKKNFIIIDFGTATTFDVIIKNQYMGGVIAPGVRLSLDTLIKKASLIKPLSLKKIKSIVGKNTKEAVRSGFYWGYIGLINNIIRLIIEKYKKNFNIILTGGFSHLFRKSLKYKTKVDKDLTIKGLLKLTRN